ncbi:MAG TPA: tetratricopeptide repeat protein [Polyangia bacterium]|nr:tetratricopeptide repeat protein [Polyangia bacterium]
MSPVRLVAMLCATCAVLFAGPAWSASDSGDLATMNKQALEAFDGLNFDQAKTLLEKAISEAESAGLGNDPELARAHLNLGMLLIAGFQNRDDAMEHFKAALTIQPDITAPPGLFNPEVQSAFDEAKSKIVSDKEAEREAWKAKKAARARQTATATKRRPAASAASEEEGSGFYLALGLGSGLGVSKGKLDANNDVAKGGTGDNGWSGGLAPSRLGHVVATVGYFVSPDLLLTLDGRLQIISGTTPVTSASDCITTPCTTRKPPSTAFAVLAKANYYFSSGDLRPYISGGLGGGAIRQVVKINVTPATPTDTTHCGASGNDPTCVDTVTGGPFLLAAGGGIAYQVGSVALLAGLDTNIGIPKFMLNFDLTLGVGFRL